jgi:hypothetical protein
MVMNMPDEAFAVVACAIIEILADRKFSRISESQA